MALKKYSVQQLFQLQPQNPSGLLLASIEQDVEKAGMSSILRIPKATRLIIDKAKDHQAARKHQAMKNHQAAQSSSEDSKEVIVTVPQASEWHYRGRAGHEIGIPQPLSAPPGIAAQRDEGFQRFYKAVASPTGHLRVTAGGRIVPNKRAPASPKPKKEATPELPEKDEQTSQPKVQEPASTANPAALPMGYPVPYPGYSPGMFGPVQMPYPPIPMGFNVPGGFPFPPFGMPRHGLNQSVDPPTAQNALHGQGLDGADGVRVSPPTQFDPTRPFVVNGQWMLPYGAQPYTPYGYPPFMAHQGYMGGPYASHPVAQAQALAQAQAQVQAHAQPQITPQAGPYPGANAQHAQNNGDHGASTPSIPISPPISSIRPSQITKTHIESLKVNLKKVDDQLKYNVHQIDVKHMEGLAKEIRDSIRALQEVLPKQLAFEDLHYPKAEKQETKPNGEPSNQQPSKPSTPKDSITLPRKNGVHGRNGMNPVKISAPMIPANPVFHRSTSTDSDSSRRFPGLPMTAATAPPFHPTAHAGPNKNTFASGEVYTEGKQMTGGRIVSNGIQALGVNRAAEKREINQAKQAGHLVNGFASSADMGSTTESLKHSVPYLVGSLPPSTNHQNAAQGSFVYPRQLTAEELEARHLYWGQAPRSAMTGLPKFDGKDFYPPSPSKPRDGNRSGTAGALDSSQTATDPFSSIDSRKTEAPTRATSYTASDELNDGGAKKEADTASDHSNAAKVRRREERSSYRKGNDLLQSMLKKGSNSPSTSALPGEVTSTTAHGYLPQYGGHAAASLTPTIANTASPRGSTGKLSESDDKTGGAIRAPADISGENCPPIDDIPVVSGRPLFT